MIQINNSSIKNVKQIVQILLSFLPLNTIKLLDAVNEFNVTTNPLVSRIVSRTTRRRLLSSTKVTRNVTNDGNVKWRRESRSIYDGVDKSFSVMAGRQQQLNRCSATQFYICNHEDLNGRGVPRAEGKNGRTMNPWRRESIVQCVRVSLVRYRNLCFTIVSGIRSVCRRCREC